MDISLALMPKYYYSIQSLSTKKHIYQQNRAFTGVLLCSSNKQYKFVVININLSYYEQNRIN